MNDPLRKDDRRKRKRDPANDSTLCGHAGHRNKAGHLCCAMAIEGTDACTRHAGIKKDLHKARGAIVVELRQWGLNGHTDLVDPGQTLLKLLTQSAARVEMYSRFLAEAVDAAERLAAAGVAPQSDLLGAETARFDLERVFNAGPVAALIGHTYAGTQTSGVIATGEKIRGLAELEAQERDRCGKLAGLAIQAGLAERMVRASEQLAGQIAQAVERTLARLGLNPTDPTVRAAVAEELMALSGGPATIEGRLA